ncbi:long-chain fatty alcohol dehydrogenase [Whalleya microplaca]|nr:long-chain fatty alcohol dehydrogenase [Whalleya microplaca]
MGDIFPEPQWQALLTLLDATIPSVKVANLPITHDEHICISEEEFDEYYREVQQKMKHPPSKEEFQAYLAVRPSDNPLFVKLIKKTVDAIPPGPKLQLYRILSVMMTRIGSLISTGYFTPFNHQSLAIRGAIIQSWRKSWFLWPALARTFVQLGTMTWSQSDPIFQGLSNYKSFAENPRSDPAPAFNFNFMQFSAATEPISIETDIVIVGSGCGGGVCAKTLAEAGHQVLVVEKGYHVPPNQLPVGPESMDMLFEGRSGALSNVDGSMVVAAGSCWGGGGTVNWSASLPTPESVRREWADVNGLQFFTTSDFQGSLDRVSDFMGLGQVPTQHNHANSTLLEGSKKLGWRAKACLTNTTAEHYCGSSCCNGCRASKKQGPSVSWLPAAVKAGAQCIEGFEVLEVLFENHKGSKKGVGIMGKWTSRDEGDSLNNPLKPNIQRLVHNPNIGKNLHLHPTCHITAVFDKDIYGWEGEMVTSVVSEFEDLGGKGHGPRLEPTSMLPHAAMFQVPWHSGLQFKMDALKYRQMNCFMALTRDKDSGSVVPNPEDGSPIVDYTPSAFDSANLSVGLAAIAKICYIQGAMELLPMVPNFPCFRCSEPVHNRNIEDANFADWVSRLEAADLKPSAGSIFGSAHQMGSCRMSTSPEAGVVDELGKVWATDNLYIADASVFPSGSGVNPMLTIMAIADHIARGILS